MFKFDGRFNSIMSGLSNMKKRLNYAGGASQQDRMIADKLRSLKSSLLSSYQAAVITVTNTGEPREFRCLINPNKYNMELDDKILSIPFEDKRVDINSNTIESIGVKPGDVVAWKGKTEQDTTYWLVYSRYLQERAYFRGQMRQCEEQISLPSGAKYWVYVKGPDTKTIDWQKTKNFIFNDLNYTLEIYISNTLETKQFFHRFAKIKMKDKNWEVQAIDDISTEGIIAVYLKEDYNNQWEDSYEEPKNPNPGDQRIIGPDQVHPFDIVTYKIQGFDGGQWSLSNKRAKLNNTTPTEVEVEITTGRSGDVSLIYTTVNGDNIVKNISILSL